MSNVLYQFEEFCNQFYGNAPTPSLMLKSEYQSRVASVLSLLKTKEIATLVDEEKNRLAFINNLLTLFKGLLANLNDISDDIKNTFKEICDNKPKEGDNNIEHWDPIFTRFQNWLNANFAENSEEEELITDLLWKNYLNSQKELVVTPLALKDLESHLENYTYQVYADKYARLGAALYKLFEFILETINGEVYSNSEGAEKLFNRYERPEQSATGGSKLNDMQRLALARNGNPYANIS